MDYYKNSIIDNDKIKNNSTKDILIFLLDIQKFAKSQNKLNEKIVNCDYIDITNEILGKTNPNYSKIKEIFEYKEYNLTNAKFDTKDITDLEISAARKIQEKMGGTIELIHRIQNEGVSTPDAKYFNEKIFDIAKYYDIKSPKKSDSLKSKSKKIYRQINETKHQANNIIISLLRENCDLSNKEAIKQIEECLKNKRYNWIESVILVGKDDVIKIYKKKKKP